MERQSRAGVALVATGALLTLSGAAVAREKAVRASAEDCAVISAVFKSHESLATLKDLLAGPIDYGPLEAANLRTAFPELTDAEVADLVAGAPTTTGENFILACNWRKLGFSLGQRWVYARDLPVSTVSRPIVGTSGRIAYVSTYAQWASLGGEGRDCLLRKTDGAWRVESCKFNGMVS